ncbi:slit homolog 3 protein-like [Culicoides brevitarsis]|uniref:slit homolog 3 protein-like n=1 Tax=Culicoides brevitarsis TaxID=469753 RepID=UPI00307C024F
MKIFFVSLLVALFSTKCYGNPIFIEVYRCEESKHSRCLLKDLLIEENQHFMPKSKYPTRITQVVLSSSTVSTLTSDICDAFPNLEELDLTGVSLKSIQKGALSSCKKLRDIRLQNNLLSQLDNDLFRENKLLSSIDLSNNKLKWIPEDLFNGLSNLLMIDLNANEISRLPSKIFDGLKSMETLFVGYNPLLSLEVEKFKEKMPQLANLIFLDVDLSCDRMKEIKDFCEANSINMEVNDNPHSDRVRSNTVSSILYKTIHDPHYVEDVWHVEREIRWKCLSNEQHEREVLLRETLPKMLSEANFENRGLEMERKFDELNAQFEMKIAEMKNKTEEVEATYLKKIFDGQTFMLNLLKKKLEDQDAKIENLEKLLTT